MPPVSLYRSPRPNSSLKSARIRSAAGGSPRAGLRLCATALGSARNVETAPHPEASTRRRFSPFTAARRSGLMSAQKPRSVAHGRNFTRSSRLSMWPSPCSQPVASSSSRSGVHIHVTAGSPFTSSQTGTSSTAADSASIRPRRLPGSGFTEILRIDVRPLLHPHGIQPHARREPLGDPLPHVDRERFAGRESLSVGKLGRRGVDVLAVEPSHDLLVEQGVELLQAHHPSRFRLKRPLDRHPALIAVPVVGGRSRELRGVALVAPIDAPNAVRRAKLNDARKIADGHAQNTRTALALKEKTTGAPGTSPRSRTASSVITATNSTPTSAAT